MEKFEHLYLHIPFCETRCSYCDFYALAQDRVAHSKREAFGRALFCESEWAASQLGKPLKTIFFGGGTPSTVSAAEYDKWLAPLDLASRIDEATEWTMEANPSSVDLDALKSMRDRGVTRISLGVQSVVDETLKLMNRPHNASDAIRALAQARRAGFKNFSGDLLCGVPGQKIEELKEGIYRIVESGADHVSIYLLTLHSTHQLYAQLPGEEIQLEHLLFIARELRDLGFERYETSNFAKPGGQCEHNLNTWRRGGYLGLGPSAHSYSSAQESRWRNHASLHVYNRAKSPSDRIEWQENLNQEQIELEKKMLGLRLSTGVSAKEFSIAKTDSLASAGYLDKRALVAGRVALTDIGFAMGDEVLKMLVGD